MKTRNEAKVAMLERVEKLHGGKIEFSRIDINMKFSPVFFLKHSFDTSDQNEAEKLVLKYAASIEKNGVKIEQTRSVIRRGKTHITVQIH